MSPSNTSRGTIGFLAIGRYVTSIRYRFLALAVRFIRLLELDEGQSRAPQVAVEITTQLSGLVIANAWARTRSVAGELLLDAHSIAALQFR